MVSCSKLLTQELLLQPHPHLALWWVSHTHLATQLRFGILLAARFLFFFLLSPSTHVTVHLTQRTNSEGGFVGRDFQLGDTMEGIMFGQSVAVSLYTAGV